MDDRYPGAFLRLYSGTAYRTFQCTRKSLGWYESSVYSSWKMVGHAGGKAGIIEDNVTKPQTFMDHSKQRQ